MWLPGLVLALTIIRLCFGRAPKAKVATECMAWFPSKYFFLRTSQFFYWSNTDLWMMIFKPVPLTCSWNTISKWVGLVYVTLITFSFSYCIVIDNLAMCIFKTQTKIVISSNFASIFWGPSFLLLVLPLKWFENEVSGMFQYLTVFSK